MPSQTQSTNHPRFQAEPEADTYSHPVLDKLRLLARLAREIERDAAEDGAPPAPRDALLTGPWTVREVPRPKGRPGYAVLRPGDPASPFPSDDGPVAVLDRRRDALRLAAVLPAVTAPGLHRLGAQAREHGFTLHHGGRFLGHLAPAAGDLPDDERLQLVTQLDLAAHLAAHPRALALLLESTGPEALPILVRTLARHIEALIQ